MPLCCFCGQPTEELILSVIRTEEVGVEQPLKLRRFWAHESCFTSFLDPGALNQWKNPA